MKYFIPFKLDRAVTLGFYHIRDVLILAAIIYLTFNLMFKYQIFMLPPITFAVTQVRIDNRTIGTHAIKAIKFISRKNNYSLNEEAK